MKRIACTLVLAVGAVACAADPFDADTAVRDSAVRLSADDVASLPVCADLTAGLKVTVHPVMDSGGLFAVAADGHLLCVDDGDGLVAQDLEVLDLHGDPGAANESGKTEHPDGTPLPAGGRADGPPR